MPRRKAAPKRVLRAVGYIRVSADMQAEEGYSLENQEHQIKEYVKYQNMQLVHIRSLAWRQAQHVECFIADLFELVFGHGSCMVNHVCVGSFNSRYAAPNDGFLTTIVPGLWKDYSLRRTHFVDDRSISGGFN